MKFRTSAIAFALTALTAPLAMIATPAGAEAATEVEAGEAAAFIESLSGQAFDVIRGGDPDDPATRKRLRTLLAEAFDVNYVGQFLVRRHWRELEPKQKSAYMAIFPEWVVATYTNNLFTFADSNVQILRAIPRGTRGDVQVFTRITPGSGTPFPAVWDVRKKDGEFKIRNLTVSGVNMALTQSEDFNAYINRNGFDELVALMKKRVA
ncbi:MAG: ABC transporter substrate-binding protein [Pseudomonadota bacterium]